MYVGVKRFMYGSTVPPAARIEDLEGRPSVAPITVDGKLPSRMIAVPIAPVAEVDPMSIIADTGWKSGFPDNARNCAVLSEPPSKLAVSWVGSEERLEKKVPHDIPRMVERMKNEMGFMVLWRGMWAGSKGDTTFWEFHEVWVDNGGSVFS